MPERKPEWALSLSTELKKWVPVHGYKHSTELADELDIPRGTFGHIYQGSAIMTGEGHSRQEFDGRFYYARLHIWTDLAEADPRHIPDRLIKIPNRDPITKNRGLSEDEYQQWLKSPDAQELLRRKDARFKRKMIMEEQTATPSQTELHGTAGSFIGSVIDDLLNRSDAQKDAVLGLLLPSISELGDRITRLEGVITGLIAQSQADRVLSPQPKTSRTNNDIGQLANHLSNLLDGYKMATSGDRDKLMQTYGRNLMTLDMIVHTLTRRPSDREEMLKLTQETKL